MSDNDPIVYVSGKNSIFDLIAEKQKGERERELIRLQKEALELQRKQKTPDETEEDGSDAKKTIYLPKSKRAREKWRKAWRILRDMRQEFLDDWEDPPPPRPEDYASRLRQHDIIYGAKTIDRIMTAGDAGKLE